MAFVENGLACVWQRGASEFWQNALFYFFGNLAVWYKLKKIVCLFVYFGMDFEEEWVDAEEKKSIFS